MYILSIGVLSVFTVFLFRVLQGFGLFPFKFGLQMSISLENFISYADGASRSTQNLSSTTWAIFAPNGELVSLQGICISRSTNNIVEYSTMFELLFDAIMNGIRRLVVRLDSQLVVLQLVGIYLVRSPTILRMALRVHLLEKHYNFIQYEHIYRNLNTLTDSLANHALDRNLQEM